MATSSDYGSVLAGQRALVTSANSGIGPGIARSLAAAGAPVAINALADPAAAEATPPESAPFGPMGSPGDVGRAVVWLASDASESISGARVYVDGGLTLSPGILGGWLT
jgi:glucose 1-dehydrogenase